ncbi:Aberrant root formation 4 -like protein [Gossypium arboreum]|uniref:Aberrant root formation 4-like protein n=1 Tax=Gossypium arboreum TaxID=29729 RepID=A0A0B0M5S4_GOSAR|nr:Aberrant root formation 4 -like protein [Gossypium arboreum]
MAELEKLGQKYRVALRLRSKNNLQKAHNDWLLPLRMLVGGIAVANKNGIDQHAVDTLSRL